MSARLLILSLVVLPFLSSSEAACGISVYWGQNGNEGTLLEACSSPYTLYSYISIAFLNTFGSGQTPNLNLAGHCSPAADTCKALASQISFCQKKGIKVLLSLGGPMGSYYLASQQDASQVADYLYYTYLGGGGGGPLGDVTLDGIDFDLEAPGSPDNWGNLAKAIAAYTTPTGDPFYLSAAVGCTYPDPNLDATIKAGVFNYVWVKFYNNPQCDLMSGVGGILGAWNTWSNNIPASTKLFMGLPASSAAATTGYVDPNTLQNQILPVIKNNPHYGGIMLWNRYFDGLVKYSTTVFTPVLLSLGGPWGSYNLYSQQDASQFAEFLYYNYLGGGGGGPLGNAVLDGVDFDIQVPGSSNYWDYLARAISAYTKPDDGKAFYLSAAVGCSYPDPIMDAAIKTGLLDSVWVKFYDNTNCDITSGVGGVLKAWNRWSYSLYPAKTTQLFMGLPGFSSATTTGYIDENTLMNKILPVIKYSPNYGGMMVWNRYYDVLANYSATVSPQLCPHKSIFFE